MTLDQLSDLVKLARLGRPMNALEFTCNPEDLIDLGVVQGAEEDEDGIPTLFCLCALGSGLLEILLATADAQLAGARSSKDEGP